MGNCVVTKVGETVVGNQRMAWGTATLSASYATGGDTLVVRDTGLQTHETVSIAGSGDGGQLLEWDGANSKVLAYQFDYDAVADGVAIQRVATTDLTGLSFTWQAWGVG